MTPFAHLHLHTEYSLLDGACRIRDMMARAKELGQEYVAITDHGVMYGVVDFYKAAKAAGIRPVLGCEVYVAPRSRFDRERDADLKAAHLVLLAENQTGYQNLMYIVSAGFTEGFYGRPRVDEELLRGHSEGLIALSACLSGSIPRLILQENLPAAAKKARELEKIFGKGNFFLELQDHGLSGQREVNRALRQIARDLDIPLVATNDVHYLNRDDAAMQDVLMCIQTGKALDDQNRMRYDTDAFYLRSGDEMAALFPDVPEALENTLKIARRCQVEIEFGKYHLPEYKPEPGEESEDHFEILKRKCEKGLVLRYGDQAGQYRERMEYELSIIRRMGFCDYFLIVQDFILYAKNNGIPVGGGRGSSANSIVSYSLRITDIDPMRFELFFDRFLNPERVSMPDIDMDFCYVRRQEVIDYVREKYGADHVAQIVTFGTMAARAVVRDVGRVMNVGYAETDTMAKLIPNELHMTLQRALEVSPLLKTRYDSDEATKKVIDMAMRLEGMPRHASTHAAGVVITDKPVNGYVPLARLDETVVTQFDMVTLEELGLLKMDFLGLRNVTVIEDAQNMVRRRHPDFNIHQVPDDDPATYKMLGDGKTVGVFQLESAGMTNLMMQMQPKSIEDMTDAVALYRPGPMDSIPKYVEGRRNLSKITYKDPMLADILAPTYGCMVYQEQVMMICRKLAGYSLGRADIVRRAMSKKKYDVLEREQAAFLSGAKERGVPEAAARSIFDEMQEFAKYAFPKGHAVAYGIIAFQTAYLKANWPREYMAALLTSVLEFTAKVSGYIAECRAMQIPVLPPDINESEDGFIVSPGGIRFGLAAVKNVGRGFILRLLVERRENGPFLSFRSFCERMHKSDLNRRTLESLIRVGAFDSLGLRRAQLLSVADRVLEGVATENRRNVSGQLDMFSMLEQSDGAVREAELPDMAEYPRRELLRMEKETAGLYLSGHPLEDYGDVLSKLRAAPVGAVLSSFAGENNDYQDGQRVLLAGMVASVRTKTTKNNSLMAYVQLEDLSGSIEMLVFAKMLTMADTLLREGAAILVRGRLSGREDEEPKLVCDEIGPLNAEGVTTYRSNGANGRGGLEDYAPRPSEEPEYTPPADYEALMDDYTDFLREDPAGGEEIPSAGAEKSPPERTTQPEAASAASRASAVDAVDAPPRKLFLRFNDQNRGLHRRTMALLRVFHGTIPVILYDEATRAYTDAERPQYIMHSTVLYETLRSLLGVENVALK